MSKRQKSIMDYIVPIICALLSGILGLFAGCQLEENRLENNATVTLYVNGNETEITSDIVNDLYNQNISLQNDIKKLNLDLSDSNEQLRQWMKQSEIYENQVVSLQNDFQILKDTNAKLSSENELLKSKNGNLEQELSSLKVPNSSIETPTILSTETTSESMDTDSILLCNLDCITGTMIHLTSTVTDNLGNEQSNVINSTFSNTFILNGQYHTLTGTIFLSQRVKNYGRPHIEVYGDGNILFDMQMEPGDRPFPFSIDISGVQELEVKTYRNTFISECRINR